MRSKNETSGSAAVGVDASARYRSHSDAQRRDEVGDRVNELFTAQWGKLVAGAARHVESAALAEEAVQEAYLQVQTKADFAAVLNPDAYVRSVVRNAARSMQRRQSCAQRYRRYHRFHLVEGDDDPDVQVASAQTASLVREACALLPERQRRVLELRYWEGLSEHEIADRLAISCGSVKTHASRGRSRLRGLLAELAA